MAGNLICTVWLADPGESSFPDEDSGIAYRKSSRLYNRFYNASKAAGEVVVGFSDLSPQFDRIAPQLLQTPTSLTSQSKCLVMTAAIRDLVVIHLLLYT